MRILRRVRRRARLEDAGVPPGSEVRARPRPKERQREEEGTVEQAVSVHRLAGGRGDGRLPRIGALARVADPRPRAVRRRRPRLRAGRRRVSIDGEGDVSDHRPLDRRAVRERDARA